MTLAASGTMETGMKSQNLRTLVRGEALSQFDLLSDDVEGTQTLDVDEIIKGLAHYFPPVNSISKQKHAMRRGMKKPRSLTIRKYVESLIGLNEYLAYFPGATFNDKISIT